MSSEMRSANWIPKHSNVFLKTHYTKLFARPQHWFTILIPNSICMYFFDVIHTCTYLDICDTLMIRHFTFNCKAILCDSTCLFLCIYVLFYRVFRLKKEGLQHWFEMVCFHYKAINHHFCHDCTIVVLLCPLSYHILDVFSSIQKHLLNINWRTNKTVQN